LAEFNSGNPDLVISNIQKALDYPLGRWGKERRAQMNYFLGTYYEKTDKENQKFSMKKL